MRKIVCFFYLLTTVVFSQEKTSLKKALNKLSIKYQIEFSFNDNEVKKFDSVSYQNLSTLKKELTSLSKQTQLIFEKIDAKNYIITPSNNYKKSICGTILSSKKGEKLEFIKVFYNGKITKTNSQGFFKINNILSKDDVIVIQSFSQETMEISVKEFNKDCLNIFLEDNIQQLSEIVITDYLTRGFNETTDGAIVLNTKKVGSLPGVIEPDVLQSIQLIPGVQSLGETVSGIHIRGSTPDQNLVLFDGMKMYHFSHFFGLVSAFNPYITSDIKLYRSGTHAKYGNNVGGVLDINIQNNIPDDFSYGLGSTLTHSDAFVKVPLLNNKIGLIASARRSITDVFNTITYKKFAEVAFQNSRISESSDSEKLRLENVNNDYFYEDYHTKIIVEPNSKNKLTFSGLYNLNNLDFRGDVPIRTESFQDKIKIKNKGIHIDWSYGSLNKGISKTSFSHTDYNKEYKGLRDFITLDKTEENSNFEKNNYITQNNFEYVFEKETNNNRWQSGFQYNNYKVYYNFLREGASNREEDVDDTIEGSTKDYSFFSEYELKKFNNWLINLGLRWQYFDSFKKGFFEPRLNVNYRFNKQLNFKFSAELKHQSIAQVIDFRSDGLGGLFDRFWALSNNVNIPLLDSYQTSIGSNFQKDGWILDAEMYYKHTNGILFLMDENIELRKYFAGISTITGLDILIKKQWTNYSSWFSYTFSKNLYQFSDLNNGNTFNGSYNTPHNFIWSHNYRLNNLEFSLGWRFRNGIPYTHKELIRDRNNKYLISYEKLNDKVLPNYQRLDVSMFYKFKFNKKSMLKGKLGLTLQNITNKQNILNRDFEIQTIIEGGNSNRVERQVLVQNDKISLGFVPNLILRITY